MLGNDPLSAAPFAALGGAVVFGRVVTARATGTQQTTALAVFMAATNTGARGTEVPHVEPSIFSAEAVANGQATDLVSALVEFQAQTSESGRATDSVVVAPSTFNADITVSTLGVATTRVAPSVFNTGLTAIASAIDGIAARPLWEVINDSQTASWQNINNAESAGWGVISDAQNPGWSSVKTQS